MIRAGWGAAAVAVMGVVLAACSGDDDPDRAVYVDAFVTSFGEEELSDEQNRCFGEAMVDSVGVEKLGAQATPDEVRESPGSVPADLGVEVTRQEGEAFYDAVSECVDIEEFFAEGLAGDDSLPESSKQCLVDGFDDAFLRDFYIQLYVGGSASFGDDSAMADRMQATYEECGLAI